MMLFFSQYRRAPCLVGLWEGPMLCVNVSGSIAGAHCALGKTRENLSICFVYPLF